MFLSCATAQKAEQERPQAQESYKTLATEKYKDDIHYLFNGSGTHVLCIRQPKPTPELPQQRADFFIYDLSTNEIILEDEISNGSVTWRNEHQLQVTLTPGTIKSEDEQGKAAGYVFDLRSKKKTDLHANELQKTQ